MTRILYFFTFGHHDLRPRLSRVEGDGCGNFTNELQHDGLYRACSAEDGRPHRVIHGAKYATRRKSN